MLHLLPKDCYFDSNLDVLVEDAITDAKRQHIIDVCWDRLKNKLLSALADVSKLNLDRVLYPVNGQKYKSFRFDIGRLHYAFIDSKAFADDYAYDDIEDCICFFILDNDGNNLDSNDLVQVLGSEKEIRHELTHWLDSFRIKPEYSKNLVMPTSGSKEYYRLPSESNAFTSMLENIYEADLKRNYKQQNFNIIDYIHDILIDLTTLRSNKTCNLITDPNIVQYVYSLTKGQYKRLRIRLISYLNFTYYRLTNNLKMIDYKKYNQDPLLKNRK